MPLTRSDMPNLLEDGLLRNRHFRESVSKEIAYTLRSRIGVARPAGPE